MKRILLPILVAFAGLAQDTGTKSVQPLRVARKAALVIGNSRYLHINGVPPAAADADDMAAALRGHGFQVSVHKDLGKEQLVQAVTGFARTQLQTGDLGVIYYSGHGGQVGDENYLLPVDYEPPAEDELVELRAYRMSRLRDAIERTGARVRVLIFDACRNSPVTTSKSPITGLRPLEAKPEGTLIAYASAHNQVARYAGNERNSFYTSELLSVLRDRPMDLKSMFELVQHRVFDRTGQAQTPYLYGFLSGPVYLGTVPEPAAASAVPRLDAATEAYLAVKDSGNADLLERFALAFPNHELASAARLKAQAIRGQAPAPPLQRQPDPVLRRPVSLPAQPETGLVRFELYRETMTEAHPGVLTLGRGEITWKARDVSWSRESIGKKVLKIAPKDDFAVPCSQLKNVKKAGMSFRSNSWGGSSLVLDITEQRMDLRAADDDMRDQTIAAIKAACGK